MQQPLDAAASVGAAADPEEAAACHMSALCVLSRLIVTHCEQLGASNSRGATGATSSKACSSSRTNSKGTNWINQLGEINLLDEDQSRKLELAYGLGLGWYNLAKQLGRFGHLHTSNRPSSSSSSSTTTGSSKSSSSSSSSRGPSSGYSNSSAARVVPKAAEHAAGAPPPSNRKWKGLQLELPPRVLELLDKAGSAAVEYRCHEAQRCPSAAHDDRPVLVEDNSSPGRRLQGSLAGERNVQLLVHLLPVCEEVIAALPLPLGCNNPRCVNLSGMSEAASAKVCTGCRKVHYCSPECIKAHWKEHKSYCVSSNV